MKNSALAKAVLLFTLLLLGWIEVPIPTWAQDSPKGSDADTAAIKQTFVDFYQSYSRHDAHATAMTFTEDADFTNMFGDYFHGQEAIEQKFSALFSGIIKDASRTDTVRNIRFYAPGIALVDADTVITGTKRADGSVGPVRKGLMIVVMTKQNGVWRFSNFHEAEFPYRAEPATP
jgi:uncharacterized protein (TIGR02246 family)